MPGRRILLVDDDPAVQRAVSALFSTEGHIVEFARGGESALAAARVGQWDIAVADPRAPGIAGQNFIDSLLEESPEWRLRLVAAPDRNDRGVVDRLRARGVAIVEKPFRLKELRETVARLLVGQGQLDLND